MAVRDTVPPVGTVIAASIVHRHEVWAEPQAATPLVADALGLAIKPSYYPADPPLGLFDQPE